MDDELAQLHRRADLLAIVDHDLMTADQLRTAISAREHGADPKQAEAATDDRAQADES